MKWRDFKRDSVHLNWHPGYAADFGGGGDPGIAQPLRCLDRHVGMTGGNGGIVASLTTRFLNNGRPLLPMFVFDHRSRIILAESRYSVPDKQAILETLSRCPSWFVAMRAVVIHTTLSTATASGLFGLLGDAPIQIVDVADTAKINALFTFAQEGEDNSLAQPPQVLHQESSSELEMKLSHLMVRQFGVDRIGSELRPAILLYLCPLMCNHPTKRISSRDSSGQRSEPALIHWSE